MRMTGQEILKIAFKDKAIVARVDVGAKMGVESAYQTFGSGGSWTRYYTTADVNLSAVGTPEVETNNGFCTRSTCMEVYREPALMLSQCGDCIGQVRFFFNTLYVIGDYPTPGWEIDGTRLRPITTPPSTLSGENTACSSPDGHDWITVESYGDVEWYEEKMCVRCGLRHSDNYVGDDHWWV